MSRELLFIFMNILRNYTPFKTGPFSALYSWKAVKKNKKIFWCLHNRPVHAALHKLKADVILALLGCGHSPPWILNKLKFSMKILRRKISAKYRLFNDCLNPKSKIYVNQNQFQREDRSEKEMLFHFKVNKHYFAITTLWLWLSR